MNSADWDYSLFWKEALQQIRHDLSEQEFMMWFKNLRYESSKQDFIILAVPSIFYRDQVKQRYQRRIEEKLHELSGSHIGIDYIIQKMDTSSSTDNSGNNGTSTETAPRELPRPIQSHAAPSVQTKTSVPVAKVIPRSKHPHLRGDYTFENFVIGEK